MVIFLVYVRWSEGMRCCGSDFVCFVVINPCVCCQPTELIWAFFFCFIVFPILLPPPPQADAGDLDSAMATLEELELTTGWGGGDRTS